MVVLQRTRGHIFLILFLLAAPKAQTHPALYEAEPHIPDLIVAADELQVDLGRHPTLTTSYIEQLEQIRDILSTDPTPDALSACQQQLRRIEGVAQLCRKKKIDRSAFGMLHNLLQRHQQLTRLLVTTEQEFTVTRKAYASASPSARQKLAEEFQKRSHEHKQRISQTLAKVAMLEKHLFLKDRRSGLSRYQSVFITAGIILIVLIASWKVCNSISRR